MRDFWDEKARENARHSMLNLAVTEKELRASGAEDAEILLSDLGRYLTSDSSVLEIGCGIGRLMEPMAGRFREVWGVDISGEMIRRGHLRLAHLANVRLVENSGSNLEGIPSEHFDLCYSYLVLTHAPERSVIEGYIRETHRVLKAKGILKFQVGGVYAINLFRQLYDESRANTWSGVRFTMYEIVSMVEEAGFQMMAAYHLLHLRTSHQKQRYLCVVARKDRGMDEWESVCFAAGQALARVVPPASSVILPEPEMIDHLEVAGAKDVEFLYADPPADSADAIATVERLRARGGAYLLFTRYGRWWLELYPEFAEHLDARYRRAEDREECVIFDLRQPIA